MEIIIEEITRGHKLLGRHRFSNQIINIGRGYDNDVIISDPHVCADHLQLQFDGEDWFVQDQGSINGSFFDGKKEKTLQHKVRSGDIIRIGKSQLRLLFPTHAVAESLAISPFENLINVMRHPAALAFNVIVFTLIACWVINLNNIEEVTLTQLLVPTIGLTLGFVFWPVILALISHLTKHEARFWSQMGISFFFFNLMWLSDALEYIIHFNTSSSFSLSWLMTTVSLVIAFGLFWLNCYVGFHTSARRRNIISASLVLLLFGSSFIIQLSQKPDFNPHPKFNTTIISPMFLFTSSSDVETFVNDSKALFDKVDKIAEEEKKEKES